MTKSILDKGGSIKGMRTEAIKEKRSYTLSSESVAFLERLHKTRRTRSVSAALDELLIEVRRQRGLRDLDAAVGAYYSGENTEDEDWARFAETEFAAIPDRAE
jgi:hypothetical protein